MLVMLLNEAVGQTSPATVMIKNDVPFITGDELALAIKNLRVVCEELAAGNITALPEANQALALLLGSTVDQVSR